MNRQTLENLTMSASLLTVIFLFIGVIADEPISLVIAAVFGLITLCGASGVLYDELKE